MSGAAFVSIDVKVHGSGLRLRSETYLEEIQTGLTRPPICHPQYHMLRPPEGIDGRDKENSAIPGAPGPIGSGTLGVSWLAVPRTGRATMMMEVAMVPAPACGTTRACRGERQNRDQHRGGAQYSQTLHGCLHLWDRPLTPSGTPPARGPGGDRKTFRWEFGPRESGHGPADFVDLIGREAATPLGPWPAEPHRQ